MSSGQAASKVLMIEPIAFRANEETASDNHFQQLSPNPLVDAQQNALQEFRSLVLKLQNVGVEVWVERDTQTSDTPDSIFPNNWFSTHKDLAFVLYPLCHSGRRVERRSDIVSKLMGMYANCVDLTHHEEDGLFLEGTGSMVLDRLNRKAYANVSRRTSAELVTNWCKLLGYSPVIFESKEEVYHTNVLMSIGSGYSIVCFDVLTDDSKKLVRDELEKSGIEPIAITYEQLGQFCGNVLELVGSESKPILAMSLAAHNAFTNSQIERIGSYAEPLFSPIPCIERCGGGGVRCMIAEIF